MTAGKPILECVPNFSEGVDKSVIEAISRAITKIPGQQLLHIDPSAAANRTVFTFAGKPEAVVAAAFESIKVAADKIDMRLQKGTHPRLGATDVCPLIPLQGMTMAEAVHWADVLAQRVAAELNIPVYLYENSSKEKYRKALPNIRKGQYEGLKAKMALPEWQPDYGPSGITDWESIAATGATIIGAREILVAFNVSLNTKDESIAKAIAIRMRSSSKGLLPALRAIGWYMDDFDCAQVSMNLLDYRVTSPLAAWETCKTLAAEYGVAAVGCEVVGLIPEACVLEAGEKALAVGSGKWGDGDLFQGLELWKSYMAAGIDYLGLDKVKPFVVEEKVLEVVLRGKGLLG